MATQNQLSVGLNIRSSLKAAISNVYMAGLVSSRKRTFGHLARMNGGPLLSVFAQLSGLARRAVIKLKKSNATRDFPFSVQ